jgi:hypothetical protein
VSSAAGCGISFFAFCGRLARRKKFAVGGIAGFTDTCVTMPLDTIKTQMQLTKGLGLMDCGKNIVKVDGVAGLYAGFPPFAVQASGKAAVRFFMYDVLCKVVDSTGMDRKKNPALSSLLCGTGAGICEALFWTCPTERLKVLKQSMAGSGTQAMGLKEVLATQGVRGLYAGAGATTARQASSVAIRFTVMEQLSVVLCSVTGSDPAKPSAWVPFLAGGLGGAISVIFNNPADVVKSKMQAGYSGGNLACIRDIIKERGVTAFGAGLSARVPRLFMSQAIQFAMVAQIRPMLGK